MPLAVLCSGQGAQHPQMFRLTAQARAAQPLFEQAAGLLGGEDPRELVRTAPPPRLQHNETAQLLCTLAPAALCAACAELAPRARLIAGYSVGEMAAWHVACMLEAPGMLRLVHERAALMSAAGNGAEGLVAVRGLKRSQLDQLCAQSGACIAIINPGDAFIVGGSSAALARFAELAERAGAKRLAFLAVQVAAHTPRMSGASAEFGKRLQTLQLNPLRSGVRLLSGIDGTAVFDVAAGLQKLARQLANTIDWSACLQSCLEAGATAFLELGPGRGLSAMAQELAPHLPARSADEFRSLE